MYAVIETTTYGEQFDMDERFDTYEEAEDYARNQADFVLFDSERSTYRIVTI